MTSRVKKSAGFIGDGRIYCSREGKLMQCLHRKIYIYIYTQRILKWSKLCLAITHWGLYVRKIIQNVERYICTEIVAIVLFGMVNHEKQS